MVGFKTSATNNFSYTAMPHAIYINGNTLRIYEDGSDRAIIGPTIPLGVDHDYRIALKAAGATYYYRRTGDPDWIMLYDSVYSTTTNLMRGVTSLTSGI